MICFTIFDVHLGQDLDKFWIVAQSAPSFLCHAITLNIRVSYYSFGIKNLHRDLTKRSASRNSSVFASQLNQLLDAERAYQLDPNSLILKNERPHSSTATLVLPHRVDMSSGVHLITSSFVKNLYSLNTHPSTAPTTSLYSRVTLCYLIKTSIYYH